MNGNAEIDMDCVRKDAPLELVGERLSRQQMLDATLFRSLDVKCRTIPADTGTARAMQLQLNRLKAVHCLPRDYVLVSFAEYIESKK